MKYTIEQLTKLVGYITGWGESVNITFSYQRRARMVSHDETELTSKYLFSVAAKMCGADLKLEGYGNTLEDALLDLAIKSPGRIGDTLRWYESKEDNAKKQLAAFFAAFKEKDGE